MNNIKFLDVRVVKEKAVRYETNAIAQPRDIFKFFTKIVEIDKFAEEVLYMLTLDTKNKVTGVFLVSKGSINQAIVHPREVYKRALLNNATSIILVHNHPSGNAEMSNEDRHISIRLKEVGTIIGINLLGSIIIAGDSYVSLKEKGVM
jgi:DNA repair protein RadC